MQRLPLAMIAAAALSAPAWSQATYTLDVDPARSNAMWDGDTNLGPINGNPTQDFQFAGTVQVEVGAPGSPFFEGTFVGGSISTIPTELSGRIPNPIPFTPPLAIIDVRNLKLSPTSDPFPIDAAGNFTAIVVMEVLDGEVEIDPWLGTPTITPLAGLITDPVPVTGTLTDNGVDVTLNLPLDLLFDLTGSVTGFFSITGDVTADAALLPVNATLASSNVVAGQNATFDVTAAVPNCDTYLVYSLAGLGSTPVAALNVTLGVSQPVLAAGPTQTDASGAVSWSLPIPGNASGANVWLQAAQPGVVSNVDAVTVQ